MIPEFTVDEEIREKYYAVEKFAIERKIYQKYLKKQKAEYEKLKKEYDELVSLRIKEEEEQKRREEQEKQKQEQEEKEQKEKVDDKDDLIEYKQQNELLIRCVRLFRKLGRSDKQISEVFEVPEKDIMQIV